jgi:hypothetical protein
MLLLGAVVLAAARDAETQRVAIEGEARLGIADHDRGVVDAQEEPPVGLLPARVALPLREGDQLEEVSVRVAKVEGLDAGGVRIPVGEALRARRGVLDAIRAQLRVGLRHVGDDDGDVLEPAVVAAAVLRERAPARRQEFVQLERLAAEPHRHHPQARAEHAPEALDGFARHLDV